MEAFTRSLRLKGGGEGKVKEGLVDVYCEQGI